MAEVETALRSMAGLEEQPDMILRALTMSAVRQLQIHSSGSVAESRVTDPRREILSNILEHPMQRCSSQALVDDQ